MTADLIRRFGYLGIVLLLVLGGLGLPVPEEAPVILAAVLSRRGSMWWPLALGACFSGVLLGDFIVYFLGYFYGEKVLSFRLTRKFLTRAREAQIKGYFHRHGIKIMILGRFAVGFRTAAYLTAGILRLPALRLLLADLFAACLSTFLMFGAGYFFANWIESGLKEAKHYTIPVLGVIVAIWLLYRFYKERRRAGLPVGPPVPFSNEVPIPPDDLHAGGGLGSIAGSRGAPRSESAAVQKALAGADAPEANSIDREEAAGTASGRAELLATEEDPSRLA
jgi:membrane protein DedA with SNARE-associated domain